MSQQNVTSSQKTDVLIVTATKTESAAVLSAFEGCSGTKSKTVTIGERTYRDLGVVNDTSVFMVQSEMGTSGLGASLQTVRNGIDDLSPPAVIMVGIVFGIDIRKQSIGDVCVSKLLSPYELCRIGTEEGNRKVNCRGGKPDSSPWLLRRFRNADIDWGEKVKVHFGVVLSGEKLIDNRDYRAELLKIEPEAIGGEMEGQGLYSACQEKKVDWILVKAICDWADGNKAENKAENQRIAAENAVKFVLHMLQQAPLKRDANHELPRTLPITAHIGEVIDHPHVILTNAQEETVNLASFVNFYNIGKALTYAVQLRLALKVKNVGNCRVENVVVELSFPKFTENQWTFTQSLPKGRVECHSTSDGYIVSQRIEGVAVVCAEFLLPLELPVVHERGDQSSLSFSVEYRVRSNHGLHVNGCFDVAAEFNRSEQVQFIGWRPVTQWLQNCHHEKDVIRVTDPDGHEKIIQDGDVFEMDSSIADYPANCTIGEWKRKGWLRQISPPPWSQPGARTYFYYKYDIPRLVAWRRSPAPPRVLTHEAGTCSLDRQDIELPENKLLRNYILDGHISTVDKKEIKSPQFLKTQPTTNCGIMGGTPCCPKTYRPLNHDEYRETRIKKGKRPRDIREKISEYSDRLRHFLLMIIDPNGYCGASFYEASTWFDCEISPKEVKIVLSELERRQTVKNVYENDDMFVVLMREEQRK